MASGATQDKGSPAKRARTDFAEDIVVLVGLQEKRFVAHKNIICAKSKFFLKACAKEWTEGRDRLVRLPDHEPDTFAMYLSWVYQHEVEFWTKEDVNGMEKDAEFRNRIAETCYPRIRKLFVLADVLDDIRLRNGLVDIYLRFARLSRSLPGMSEVAIMWEVLPPTASLNRLTATLTALALDYDDLVQTFNGYPKGFVEELFRLMAANRLLISLDSERLVREFHELPEGAPEGAPKCV